MTNVIDFNSRLATKKEADELDRLTEFLVTKILPYMTYEQKLELIEVIETKDAEKYFALTEPIIMRNEIKEINQ